jgi:hypothetical protein
MRRATRAKIANALPGPFPTDSERDQFNEFRCEIAQSQLEERISAAIASVNRVGQQALDEVLFLQPQSLQRVCAFEKSGMEYEMALALRPAGPVIIFSSWERRAPTGWTRLKFLTRLFRRKRSAEINREIPIQPAAVTDDEIQDWLIYLLSGFRHSFKSAKKVVPFRRAA